MKEFRCPHCSKKLYLYPTLMQVPKSLVTARNGEIVTKFLQGERQSNLAREYGISTSRIDQIIRTTMRRIDPKLHGVLKGNLVDYRDYNTVLIPKINSAIDEEIN